MSPAMPRLSVEPNTPDDGEIETVTIRIHAARHDVCDDLRVDYVDHRGCGDHIIDGHIA